MEMQPLSALNKQSKSFNRLIRLLTWKFEPQQLFCFAKISVYQESSSSFTAKRENVDCHYCLLMVTTSDVPTAHTVQKFINARFKTGGITVLCHSQKRVSNAIKAKDRFFVTIYGHAQLLYSCNELLQSEYIRNFSTLNALTKAERKFSHYIALADAFFAGATHCFKNGEHTVCAMMLHHTVEQCIMLLVSLNLSYRVESYSLYDLLRLCSSFSDQPQQLLLATTEDKRLFEILIKGRSGVNCGIPSPVGENDAKQLLIRVSTFIKLTRLMCKDKIERLKLETLSYGQPNQHDIN
ncbi:hypothetical protein [Pedobacter sp. GR22-6]|uniref:hypothetical protein n=1 Tax=Pedobacter sp. GR22-6 TaxID=3127957 RepID=UPI00307D6091